MGQGGGYLVALVGVSPLRLKLLELLLLKRQILAVQPHGTNKLLVFLGNKEARGVLAAPYSLAVARLQVLEFKAGQLVGLAAGLWAIHGLCKQQRTPWKLPRFCRSDRECGIHLQGVPSGD